VYRRARECSIRLRSAAAHIECCAGAASAHLLHNRFWGCNVPFSLVQIQLAYVARLFGRCWQNGEWCPIVKGPGYRPQLLFRPQLPPRPSHDAVSAPPSVRLHTRMTRGACVAVISHSIIWLAGVFVLLSFPIPSHLAAACCCCCILNIVAGGMLLSAHVAALPLLCISHAVSVLLSLGLRQAALAAGYSGVFARWCSEAFLICHSCALLLLLLQGRAIVVGVKPELAPS
jgi:hypothetical protein